MEDEKYILTLMKEFMHELLHDEDFYVFENSDRSMIRKYQTTLVSSITTLHDGNLIEAVAITDDGEVEIVMAAENNDGTLVVLEHLHN